MENCAHKKKAPDAREHPTLRILPLDYFGQPIRVSSASGRSLASRAASGSGMPFGTSQISTRRFLASPASTAAPLRSLGAVVDTVHDVASDSVCCVEPTQTPLMRERSSELQVPEPPLRTPAVWRTRLRSRLRLRVDRPLGSSLAST